MPAVATVINRCYQGLGFIAADDEGTTGYAVDTHGASATCAP